MNKLIEERYAAVFDIVGHFPDKSDDVENMKRMLVPFKRDIIYLGEYRDDSGTYYVMDATVHKEYTEILKFETVGALVEAVLEARQKLSEGFAKSGTGPSYSDYGAGVLMWVTGGEPVMIPNNPWFKSKEFFIAVKEDPKNIYGKDQFACLLQKY